MPIGSALSERTTFANVLLYGPEGTGKTTDVLRMTRLGRVVLINAEGGAKKQALVQRGIDPDLIEVRPEEGEKITFDMLESVVTAMEDALRESPGYYAGLALDSGTEIARVLVDEAVSISRERDTALGKNRPRFQINLEDYGVSSSMQRSLLRRFRDLPCHVFWTALERRDLDDDGRVRYGPAMSPAVATDTLGLVDVVGYCMVEEVGSAEVRSAHFSPVTRRRAKDRFGLLPRKMADPFADRIIAYIDGSLTKENDQVRAAVMKMAQEAKRDEGDGSAVFAKDTDDAGNPLSGDDNKETE